MFISKYIYMLNQIGLQIIVGKNLVTEKYYTTQIFHYKHIMIAYQQKYIYSAEITYNRIERETIHGADLEKQK